MRAHFRKAAAQMMLGREINRMGGLVDELERRSDSFTAMPGDYLDFSAYATRAEVVYRRVDGIVVARWSAEEFEALKKLSA